MKKLLLPVLAALVLSGCGSSSNVTLQDSDAFAATILNSDVVVLDVRTPAEFNEGHIPNAINIDAESATFESQIATLDKTKEYAVYCRSGRRSAIATELMSKTGFTNLKELDGGLLSWNGPIIKP